MNSQHPASQEQERRSRRWLFLMILMVIFSLLCLALSLWLPGLLRRSMVGLPLHSVLSADYNRDPSGYAMPELELALIDNTLIDEPGAALVIERVATLRSNLLTPVPTVTPRGPQPAATLAQPSPTQRPAGSASATPAPLLPTAQHTQTLAPTATPTASVLPPTRTATRTATRTTAPPTRTATASPSASPTGTATTQPAPTIPPPPTEAPTIPPYPPPVSPSPPPYPLGPH